MRLGVTHPRKHTLGGVQHTDLWLPWQEDSNGHAVIAQSFDHQTSFSFAGENMTSARTLAVALVLPKGVPVGHVALGIGNQGLTRGSNGDSHSFGGLATQAGVILAKSADDQAGAIAANGLWEVTLTAPYTPADDIAAYAWFLIDKGTGGAPLTPNLLYTSVFGFMGARRPYKTCYGYSGIHVPADLGGPPGAIFTSQATASSIGNGYYAEARA